ncbi:MAG: hypothetical protein M3Y59_18505 [Myxococcota bacterium]|nr:hypothetical protein [Myxococcota bacterium]
MLLPAVLAVLVAASPVLPGLDELTVDLEMGPALVVQNDNRYGATGTLYSADDVGQRRNLFIGMRLSVEAVLAERHRVIFLYAPLDLTTRVTLERDVDFRGTVFNAGEVVDHRYLFDGYRGSYLYRLILQDRLRWDVGGSLQIRNASVELRSVDSGTSRFAVENDIGLVVALKTRLTWIPNPALWTTLEADGISSFGIANVSGALYDVSLSVGTPVRQGVDVFLRLRWLGGGAEVPNRNIENWANLFFATAGVRGDLTRL